ncbi:protein of unknown function [Cyanobium sp. NIES-981]|nr:protein of unknown function [Cyanobium sp. NIES-981]
MEREWADAGIPGDDDWFDRKSFNSLLHRVRQAIKATRFISSRPRCLEQPAEADVNTGEI